MILPDNDSEGRAHAEAIASDLGQAGLDVRVVHLADETGETGADAADWAASAQTAEERESAAQLLAEMAERTDAPAAPDHSWVFRSLNEVANAPPEPPTILGLFYPGKQHLVSGEPEALKSWLGLIACLEEIKAGRHAAYVDLEMGERDMLNRARDLGIEGEILDRFLYADPSEVMTSATIRAYIDELFSERRPSVVVIDSYEGALFLHGLKPNESDAIEAFHQLVVRPLLAHGAAVILIDHVTKDKEHRGRFSVGSQRKLGITDVHLGLDMVKPFGRSRQGIATIETNKDRPAYLPRPKAGELTITSDPLTGSIDWAIKLSSGDDEFRPTVLMERVSRPSRHGLDHPHLRHKSKRTLRAKREPSERPFASSSTKASSRQRTAPAAPNYSPQSAPTDPPGTRAMTAKSTTLKQPSTSPSHPVPPRPRFQGRGGIARQHWDFRVSSSPAHFQSRQHSEVRQDPQPNPTPQKPAWLLGFRPIPTTEAQNPPGSSQGLGRQTAPLSKERGRLPRPRQPQPND